MQLHEQEVLNTPYTQQECSTLANELRTNQRISESEHNRLMQLTDEPDLFSEQLVKIYQERALTYLKNTRNQLICRNQLSANVAEDLVISYLYAALAQQDYYTSPFALMTLARGNIAVALQPNPESNDVIRLLDQSHCALGVSLGFYSIAQFLIACQRLPDNDAALDHVFAMNKAVFIAIVPMWQLYKDIGFTALARLNSSSQNLQFSPLLLNALALHQGILLIISAAERQMEQQAEIFAAVFSTDNNVTLVYYFMRYFSTYIQQDILQPYYQAYLAADRTQPLHQEISQLFSITQDDRLAFMHLIYFPQQLTAINFVRRFADVRDGLAAILQQVDNLCGAVCSPAFRQFNRKEKTQEFKLAKINAIARTVNDFVPQAQNHLEQVRQLNEQRHRTTADAIAQNSTRLDQHENEVVSHYQGQQTTLTNWLANKNNELLERARRIDDLETGATTELQTASSAIDRRANELREQIRTPAFFWVRTIVPIDLGIDLNNPGAGLQRNIR